MRQFQAGVWSRASFSLSRPGDASALPSLSFDLSLSLPPFFSLSRYYSLFSTHKYALAVSLSLFHPPPSRPPPPPLSRFYSRASIREIQYHMNLMTDPQSLLARGYYLPRFNNEDFPCRLEASDFSFLGKSHELVNTAGPWE